jgi:hypothetical protein
MNENPSLPPTMIWQIFRKDFRLLWPLALTGAAAQALLVPLRSGAENNHGLAALAGLLTFGLVIAMSLLIVLAVQQDAIPGVNQDWLVRPIKRRDLLLAKVFAVLLLINGPIAAVGLVRGLGDGLSFPQVLLATLLSSFEVALVFSLPVMAIAALTKSVTEAILGALVVALALIFTYLLITRAFHVSHPTEETGVAWVGESLSHAVLLLVTVAVLMLQYFRRSTVPSRALFAGGLLLFMWAPALPWQPAFAIQRWFSSGPDADRAFSIAFDASVGKQAAEDSAGKTDWQLFSDGMEEKKSGSKDTRPVLLPLRLSGLPAGLALHADRSAMRLVDADGKIIYRGTGHVFDLPPAEVNDGPAQLRQTFEIPDNIYRQAADQSLRLELDYSLTLLRPRALPPLAALNGRRRLPDVGHCTSGIGGGGTAIEVNCRAAGEMPSCMSMVLERTDGRRNPEIFDCEFNYEPSPLRFSVDPIGHSETKLPFLDSSGSAHYPVDETRLNNAQVVLTVYEPEDHFSKRIVVPQFRLRDWQKASDH